MNICSNRSQEGGEALDLRISVSFQSDVRNEGEEKIKRGRLVKRLVLVFNDQRKSIISFDVEKRRVMMTLKRLASMVLASSLNQFLKPSCMDFMVNIL